MKKKIVAVAFLVLFVGAVIFSLSAESDDIVGNSKELFKNIQLFTDSIALIIADYVEPVKAKDLIYGAIRGMMYTLDGYSQFLDPEGFQEIKEETQGKFAGIGIRIGIRDSVLTVIAPMEGTPAFAAGLKTADKIVEIDGEMTHDMSLDDAVKRLRGEVGTDVAVGIVREEVEDVLNFTIKRAIIEIESIKDVKVIEDDIGYIKIVEFQERTVKDLRESLKDFKEKGIEDLIIDVRNNPGGLLKASVGAADLFLDEGALIVYTEGRDPRDRVEFRAKKKLETFDTKLVILVNKGSASASEILAGAIKDNDRGLIVGTVTFGKGSVQTVIPLKDDSALRLTIASYYTPSGKTIRDAGVEPDVLVEREEPEESGDKEKKEKKEQQEVKDNQLEAAIRILKEAKTIRV